MSARFRNQSALMESLIMLSTVREWILKLIRPVSSLTAERGCLMFLWLVGKFRGKRKSVKMRELSLNKICSDVDPGYFLDIVVSSDDLPMQV